MADTAAPTTGRGATRYLCGVPPDDCRGSAAILSAGFKAKGYKIHNTSTEAFNCMKQHLLKQGYTQVDSRAFSPPGGGPIRVLTKKSRYGAKMRPGKGGRNMPSGRTGGIVTSC